MHPDLAFRLSKAGMTLIFRPSNGALGFQTPYRSSRTITKNNGIF
jgi:hypothetical protein